MNSIMLVYRYQGNYSTGMKGIKMGMKWAKKGMNGVSMLEFVASSGVEMR
jgi:hypothetical protein